MRFRFGKASVACTVLAATVATGALADSISEWDPASGLKPNEIDDPYGLFLSSGASEPDLEAENLIIDTTSDSQNALYRQAEPMVNTSDGFSFVANIRLLSGSSSSLNRAPVTLFFTVAPATGMLMNIDVDRVFFSLSGGIPGPEALVDTDDAMHNYRVEYDGVSTFTLFYDDLETISAVAQNSQSDHGDVERIGWGEGSSFAFGVSQWGPVMHNALDLIFWDDFQIPDLSE